MQTNEIVERLRARRPELEARGVEGLAIFGSRARGDNREDSDLDLLLDIPKGSRFSLIDLVAIERQIGEDLGVAVGAVLRRSLKEAFARRIADDVIDVF
ncbi:MAG TPA: nucleotidyltransferase domain-containing protein [Methylocystis sp.]|nr:nucleotidyltransferase domain-containing protein [Methylocystis sp.]